MVNNVGREIRNDARREKNSKLGNILCCLLFEINTIFLRIIIPSALELPHRKIAEMREGACAPPGDEQRAHFGGK